MKLNARAKTCHRRSCNECAGQSKSSKIVMLHPGMTWLTLSSSPVHEHVVYTAQKRSELDRSRVRELEANELGCRLEFFLSVSHHAGATHTHSQSQTHKRRNTHRNHTHTSIHTNARRNTLRNTHRNRHRQEHTHTYTYTQIHTHTGTHSRTHTHPETHTQSNTEI